MFSFFVPLSALFFSAIIYCAKPFIQHETMSEKGREKAWNMSQFFTKIGRNHKWMCHFQQHDNKLIPFLCNPDLPFATITVIFPHFLRNVWRRNTIYLKHSKKDKTKSFCFVLITHYCLRAFDGIQSSLGHYSKRPLICHVSTKEFKWLKITKQRGFINNWDTSVS